MRRALLALAAVSLLPAATLAADYWRPATVSTASTLRARVAAEHLRVCGQALVSDSQLTWVARWKAQDMGYRGYFAHRAKDGAMVWDFYARAGIPWAHGAGEIIAWNSYPDSNSAEAAYQQFMGSAAHRGAIRYCGYDHFGVGAFKVASGKKLYVVEFTNR